MTTELSDLIGSTLTEIRGGYKNSHELVFVTTTRQFRFYHEQDCCESVLIEDIIGDMNDLLHSPILVAEVVTSRPEENEYCESATWTFYKFRHDSRLSNS